MKKSTRLILAASAVGFGLAANAQVTFTKSEGTFPEGGVFSNTHRYNAFAADLNNSGRMDIIYGGQLDSELNGESGLPGIWGWSQQQGIYYNLGSDSWKQDKYTSAISEGEFEEKDGQQVQKYHVEPAKHGLRGNCYANYAAIDYNNDGLVDLIFNGKSNGDDWLPYDGELKKNHLCLYKNNGDGTFTMVPEAVFPVGSPDNDAKGFNISTGDFDRDGYVDFLVSYCLDIDDEKAEFNNGMGRFVGLYKNMNGTGEFKRINDIAETKGGVWTKEVRDDQNNVVTPSEKIEGAFLQISGNAILADVNNDGWLDIVLVGYVSDCWDPNHTGGGYKSRIYLSQEGKKFVDVTPESAAYVTCGDAATALADMNGDGYLDMLNYGWDGNQRGAYLFMNTQDAEAPFDDMPLTSDDTNLPHCQARFFVRDMDGDGTPDVVISGKEYTDFPGESSRDMEYLTVCYNTGMDTFDRTEYEDLGKIGDAGRGMVADFDGDGLSDYFCGGYGQKAGVFYNKGEKPVVAEAPANVQVEYVDGKLNITWDEVADAEAYNVFVTDAAGKTYALVPADPATGFVKVSASERVAALRPNQTSYSITVPEGNYKVGVQTVSLLNETSSPFTTADLSGINGVGADFESMKMDINVTDNGIYIAGTGEAVEVYNAMGQKVAAGVAGKFIPTSAKGVLIVARGTETAKIVK